MQTSPSRPPIPGFIPTLQHLPTTTVSSALIVPAVLVSPAPVIQARTPGIGDRCAFAQQRLAADENYAEYISVLFCTSILLSPLTLLMVSAHVNHSGIETEEDPHDHWIHPSLTGPLVCLQLTLCFLSCFSKCFQTCVDTQFKNFKEMLSDCCENTPHPAACCSGMTAASFGVSCLPLVLHLFTDDLDPTLLGDDEISSSSGSTIHDGNDSENEDLRDLLVIQALSTCTWFLLMCCFCLPPRARADAYLP